MSLDHIAMPSKRGAMEDWGLISYGETSLTFDPQNDSLGQKIRVLSVISHEVAHQVSIQIS